jgi:hypothetical protein
MSLPVGKDVRIESSLPLTGLKKLTTSTSSSFQQFIYVEKLNLYVQSMSRLYQHGLKCLPNLKELELLLTLKGYIFYLSNLSF